VTNEKLLQMYDRAYSAEVRAGKSHDAAVTAARTKVLAADDVSRGKVSAATQARIDRANARVRPGPGWTTTGPSR
jgi:hypothetical protein